MIYRIIDTEGTLLPVRKSVIANRIEDCRCEAMRLEQSISHIANSTVRRGYNNEE